MFVMFNKTLYLTVAGFLHVHGDTASFYNMLSVCFCVCPDAHIDVCVCLYAGVFMPLLRVYLVLGVEVGDFQCGHGSRHGLHGCEDVLEDAFCKGPPLLF